MAANETTGVSAAALKVDWVPEFVLAVPAELLELAGVDPVFEEATVEEPGFDEPELDEPELEEADVDEPELDALEFDEPGFVLVGWFVDGD